MIFRDYEKSDINGIKEIASLITEWKDYLPERIDEYLESNASYPVVIEMNQKIVSVGNLRFVSEDFAWLEAVRTHPEFRGEGLGEFITRKMIDKAIELGAKQIWFMTAKNNIGVGKIAEKVGFVEDHTIYLWNYFDSECDEITGLNEKGLLVDISKLEQHIEDIKQVEWLKIRSVDELDPKKVVYSEFLAYPAIVVGNWVNSGELFKSQQGDVLTIRESEEMDNMVVIGISTSELSVLVNAIKFSKELYPEKKISGFFPSTINSPLFSDWEIRVMIYNNVS